MARKKKAAAMTEFHTVKRIDNSRIVRHVEPLKMRKLYRTVALGGVIAAFFMLYVSQHLKRRDHPAQRDRAVQFAHLQWLDVAHDARIVDPLDGVKLGHCRCFFFACHNNTLSAAKLPAFFPHTAASRFANAGCPSSLPHWA